MGAEDAILPTDTRLSDLGPLTELLRCLECRSPLRVTKLAPGGRPDLGPDGMLACVACAAKYPLIAGTARMLRGSITSLEFSVKRRTAESFAFEWQRFGVLRDEWRKNFLDYMRPHGPGFFEDKLVLDVGAGSGRHSYWAHRFGGRVVAVDLGDSIDVARRNLPADVLTVQADAEDLPFADGSFDLVLSIGVLHHLADPGRALRSLVRCARPGGLVRIYLYWQLPGWQGAVLGLVSLARRVTIRLPHRLLHVLCYPLAALMFAVFVLPYRWMRGIGTLHRVAERLPLKTYADYPFIVCVNDQFDRFSAPLEQRFTRADVEALLASAGLRETDVIENHGWVGAGRRSHAEPSHAAR